MKKSYSQLHQFEHHKAYARTYSKLVLQGSAWIKRWNSTNYCPQENR